MSRLLRASCAVAALMAGCPAAFSQDNTQLPTIDVLAQGGTLTAPTFEQARERIERTPGGVEVVPDTAYKPGPAATVKDVVDYVPGVWAQPKWGEDSRLSIRGSGLSRNFHLRGIQLYMDGIPINTADGYGDFQEIDPSAYRYVEIFKGANALRFGANSMGGAINFVTPSGRDAKAFDGRIDGGSFRYARGQASTAGVRGPFDWFVTGSGQEWDGFRDRSDGFASRGNANAGYQISPDAETRFYLNGNHVRQRIPGSVTKVAALNWPTLPAINNVRLDQQRNIDTVRVANKTAVRLGSATVEFGVFGVDRHLQHPIFQWLDYRYADYGSFARVTGESFIGGYRNRWIAGVNLHNGSIDNNQYANLPGGIKGTLLSSSVDKSNNVAVYAENSFYVLPTLALVAGTQFLYAARERDDRFLINGDQSGRRTFDLWNPKVGVLWDVDPAFQVFGNVSRSSEVPSFGENSFATAATSFIQAQTATTYEVGTRGRRPDVTWDVALYRADIKNELQCLTTVATPGSCTVTNADRTVHQGIELGFGAAVLRGLATADDRVWINLAYTYNDFFFDGDRRFGFNRLPGAPPHYLRGEMVYRHPNGFYIGPNVEWVPEAYFVDNANTVTTEPYALLNFKVGFDRGDGLSGYLEGRNLTDRKYISSVSIAQVANANSALFEPGSGLGVFAGLRYRH